MMFNAFTTDKIERGRSSLENTGTRLEQEMLGEVNGRKYKELAYSFLHRDEMAQPGESKDKQFERILKMREAAQREFENALDLADRDKYIDFRNSVKLVEQAQAGDPEHPRQFFAQELHHYLTEKFSEKYFLKFFTATGGTHLDVVHGVDGFFKLYDQETRSELAMATIDLTRNDMKDKARANVLIRLSKDEIGKMDPSKENEMFDKETLNNNVIFFGDLIANALIDDYKRRNGIEN
jgi:hypothetical protein